MEIGVNSYFQGALHSSDVMRLRHGVRGLALQPVVAYAAMSLEVESNVLVRGKLASAERVKAISSPIAWLRDPQAGESV